MIRVGERSGELSDQLENAAGFYEEELDYSVDKMTAVVRTHHDRSSSAWWWDSWPWPWSVAMYGIYNQVDF